MRIYGVGRLPRKVIITYQPFLTTILEKKIASNITEPSGLVHDPALRGSETVDYT